MSQCQILSIRDKMRANSSKNEIKNTSNAFNEMNSWNLMRVEDVSKILVLDPHLGFTTHKSYKDSSVSEDIQLKIKDKLTQFNPLKSDMIINLKDDLIGIVRLNKLYKKFNIQYLCWIDPILVSYLQAMSVESPISICECNRFYNDDYRGVLVNAKRNIKKGETVDMLIGFYRYLNEDTENHLESMKLDFSIMKSNRTNDDVIMLGPASLINHDCVPNCQYIFASRATIKIQAIKNIKEGTELLCYYGSEYFGIDNNECECDTCMQARNANLLQPDENIGFPGNQNVLDKCNTKPQKFLQENEDNSTIREIGLIDSSCKTNNWSTTECLKVIPQIQNKFIQNSYYLSYPINNLHSFTNISININSNNFIITISEDCLNIIKNLSLNVEKSQNNFVMKKLYIQDSHLHNRFQQNSCVIKNQSRNSNMQALEDQYNKSSIKINNDSGSVSNLQIMQWCNQCRKGTILKDWNFKWHNTDCIGTLHTQDCSIPCVLIDLPPPVPAKRRPFCQFCASFVFQYPRHLENCHENEPAVVRMLEAETNEKRRNLLFLLRSKGFGVYFKYTGIIIPYRSKNLDAQNVEKIQCSGCDGFFSKKKTMWCHACPSEC